jgi:hypothetical protein
MTASLPRNVGTIHLALTHLSKEHFHSTVKQNAVCSFPELP